MQNRISHLFEELKNRSVIRALIAYSVVAWMLLQVADVTFDRLPIPENSMTVLIAVVIIGFPLAGILAWAYELTAGGIVRHADAGAGAKRLSLLPFLLIVVAVTALGGGLLYYASQNFWEPPRRSIAVLPFTNTGDAADTGYFSDGLTEESRAEHEQPVQGCRHGCRDDCGPARRGSRTTRQRQAAAGQGVCHCAPHRWQ
jgi:hypothetical protein